MTTTFEIPGFAERILEVIDSGRRTATYKLALLLALVDLCALQSDSQGRAPDHLNTRDLAEQIASLYWPQVLPFRIQDSSATIDLKQITNKRSAIVDALRSFRTLAEPSGATSLWAARHNLPHEFESTVDKIEQTIAEQPLPRLQTVGTSDLVFPFIYDLGPNWKPNQSFSLARLRTFGPRGPAIPLLAGAGDELLRLSPLIRPLVELHWTRMVAKLSKVATAEEGLHRHLFGSPRIAPSKMLRDGLRDLQSGVCFYCGDALLGPTEVDHFIPRVRNANDSIENLVLADRACNADKSDLLAAPCHVQHWSQRNRLQQDALSMIAELSGTESDIVGSAAVARSIYGHLPPSGSPMWLARKQIIQSDPAAALTVLAGTP